jgi:hypothetical protein
MRNTSIIITVQHLFSPISALDAESNPYIIKLRFKMHRTLQINQSNFFYMHDKYF